MTVMVVPRLVDLEVMAPLGLIVGGPSVVVPMPLQLFELDGRDWTDLSVSACVIGRHATGAPRVTGPAR